MDIGRQWHRADLIQAADEIGTQSELHQSVVETSQNVDLEFGVIYEQLGPFGQSSGWFGQRQETFECPKK